MEQIYLNIGISIASIILGHLISRVFDRPKPLLVIKEFSTGTKNTKSNCSPEVSKLTSKSWFMPTVDAGEVQWNELERAFKIAKVELKDLEGIESKVERLIRGLTSASTDNEKKTAISRLFQGENGEVLDILQLMHYRNKAILPTNVNSGTPSLPTTIHNEREGCFIFVFEEFIGMLGKNLNADDWRKKALLPFVNSIMYLDAANIIENLKLVPAIANEQKSILIDLREKLNPLRQKETIWFVKCVLTNYGNAPIIIYPEAKLKIFKNVLNKEEPIPCYLGIENEKGDDVTDAIGPMVINSHEKLNLWAITKEKMDKMPNGKIVEAHYSSGTSKAKLTILTGWRIFPILKHTTSQSMIFRE